MNEENIRSQMQEVLDLVSSDIATIRTGRVAPSLVNEIVISAYGATQKLKVIELANISITDSQTIIIEPWDKSIIGEIRQGILAANIGADPVISSRGRSASGGDGDIIRITFSPLTTEDRQKYVRLLKTKLESGRIMIRRVRTDAMREIKKSFEDKKLSEDEKFNFEKRLQGLTDEFVGKIEDMGKAKETELLQV